MKKKSKKISKKFIKFFEIFFLKIDFVEMIFREKKFKVQKIFAENREKFLSRILAYNLYIISTYVDVLLKIEICMYE